ncbi:Keratin-like protein KRT222 [Triplophysa tibetana]|uniref:Keratin-like protein KRT222 n=1 Tax=Triplophysa tibetana TaxID=1572043 RepID=A0A5A9NPL0_9TELE|nr:Keratin-like protein KRT222 [Triplophysa tibetana]
MDGLKDPKWSLRDLNERLRGFVEHVRLLEQVNRRLEEKIVEWGKRNVPPSQDWCGKEALARELRAQVSRMLMENAEVSLQSDDVKTEASHLRNRCETEEKFRRVTEQQVSQLKLKKKEVEMTNKLLENQLSQSEKEFQQIIKEQEKELDQHQRRAVLESDRVLAQVAAGENGRGMDLSRTSTRCDHSSPAQSSLESNRAPGSDPATQTRPRKDENGPTAPFPLQVRAGDGVLKEARAELTEARKRWHRLQVEIESLHALRSLQSSLHHTQQQYSTQLKDLSHTVGSLESELETVRDSLVVQQQNHSQLLDTKMRLEREIATYRKLLEHEEGRSGDRFLSSGLELKPWKGSALEQNGLLNGCEEEISQTVSTEEKTPKKDSGGNKDGEICTVKTQEILEGNVVRESAEGHGKVETESIDKVIRQWEGSFFQGNPKLRKKSVSLRFDLHMAVADEGCGQTKQDSLPNVEKPLTQFLDLVFMTKRMSSLHRDVWL